MDECRLIRPRFVKVAVSFGRESLGDEPSQSKSCRFLHVSPQAMLCVQLLSVHEVVRQPAVDGGQGRPPQGRDGGGSQPHGDLSSR